MSHGRNRHRRSAMTLVELLVAIALLGMIVLGIGQIEIFCRHAFMTTDRKTKITNEAAYIVEHMSKHIGMAISDGNEFPVSAAPAVSGCDRLIRVWTKSNLTVPEKTRDDHEVAYCFNEASHTLSYYPHIRTWPDTVTQDFSNEIMSRNTVQMEPTFDDHWNYVNLSVTTCWNASIECGSVDNPRIQMDTRIFMPSVSVDAS